MPKTKKGIQIQDSLLQRCLKSLLFENSTWQCWAGDYSCASCSRAQTNLLDGLLQFLEQNWAARCEFQRQDGLQAVQLTLANGNEARCCTAAQILTALLAAVDGRKVFLKHCQEHSQLWSLVMHAAEDEARTELRAFILEALAALAHGPELSVAMAAEVAEAALAALSSASLPVRSVAARLASSMVERGHLDAVQIKAAFTSAAERDEICVQESSMSSEWKDWLMHLASKSEVVATMLLELACGLAANKQGMDLLFQLNLEEVLAALLASRIQAMKLRICTSGGTFGSPSTLTSSGLSNTLDAILLLVSSLPRHCDGACRPKLHAFLMKVRRQAVELLHLPHSSLVTGGFMLLIKAVEAEMKLLATNKADLLNSVVGTRPITGKVSEPCRGQIGCNAHHMDEEPNVAGIRLPQSPPCTTRVVEQLSLNALQRNHPLLLSVESAQTLTSILLAVALSLSPVDIHVGSAPATLATASSCPGMGVDSCEASGATGELVQCLHPVQLEPSEETGEEGPLSLGDIQLGSSQATPAAPSSFAAVPVNNCEPSGMQFPDPVNLEPNKETSEVGPLPLGDEQLGSSQAASAAPSSMFAMPTSNCEPSERRVKEEEQYLEKIRLQPSQRTSEVAPLPRCDVQLGSSRASTASSSLRASTCALSEDTAEVVQYPDPIGLAELWASMVMAPPRLVLPLLTDPQSCIRSLLAFNFNYTHAHNTETLDASTQAAYAATSCASWALLLSCLSSSTTRVATAAATLLEQLALSSIETQKHRPSTHGKTASGTAAKSNALSTMASCACPVQDNREGGMLEQVASSQAVTQWTPSNPKAKIEPTTAAAADPLLAMSLDACAALHDDDGSISTANRHSHESATLSLYDCCHSIWRSVSVEPYRAARIFLLGLKMQILQGTRMHLTRLAGPKAEPESGCSYVHDVGDDSMNALVEKIPSDLQSDDRRARAIGYVDRLISRTQHLLSTPHIDCARCGLGMVDGSGSKEEQPLDKCSTLIERQEGDNANQEGSKLISLKVTQCTSRSSTAESSSASSSDKPIFHGGPEHNLQFLLASPGYDVNNKVPSCLDECTSHDQGVDTPKAPLAVTLCSVLGCSSSSPMNKSALNLDHHDIHDTSNAALHSKPQMLAFLGTGTEQALIARPNDESSDMFGYLRPFTENYIGEEYDHLLSEALACLEESIGGVEVPVLHCAEWECY